MPLMKKYLVTAFGCVFPPEGPRNLGFHVWAVDYPEPVFKVANYLREEQVPYDSFKGAAR